jgi:hypothetical protein
MYRKDTNELSIIDSSFHAYGESFLGCHLAVHAELMVGAGYGK